LLVHVALCDCDPTDMDFRILSDGSSEIELTSPKINLRKRVCAWSPYSFRARPASRFGEKLLIGMASHGHQLFLALTQ
jgi:hypothetical protein